MAWLKTSAAMKQYAGIALVDLLLWQFSIPSLLSQCLIHSDWAV